MDIKLSLMSVTFAFTGEEKFMMVSSSCLSLIRWSIAEEMSNTAHPVLNSSLLMDEEDEEKLGRMKEEEKLFFFFCGSDFAAQEALLGQNQNPSSSDTLSPQAPGDHSPPESESG